MFCFRYYNTVPTSLFTGILGKTEKKKSTYSSVLYILKVKDTQSCPTLCDSMDYTVHGILQARILEWAAFPFSRGSSQPRDQTWVSHIAGGFFTRGSEVACVLSCFSGVQLFVILWTVAARLLCPWDSPGKNRLPWSGLPCPSPLYIVILDDYSIDKRLKTM